MLSKKAFGAALFGLAGLALAQAQLPAPAAPRKSGPPAASDTGNAPAPRPPPQGNAQSPPRLVVPRAPLPKVPNEKLSAPAGASGRLIVKFKDDVKARVTGEKVQSVSAANLSAFQQIVDAHALTVRSAFSLTPEQLRKIQDKAATHSGTAQPDLAGMVYLESPGGVALAAAQALNGLDGIEFVSYEPGYGTKGGPGACCLPNITCVITATPAECINLLGNYQGDTTVCGDGCGGCCVPQPDGSSMCQDGGGGGMVEGACTALAGEFQGAGSNCTAINCESEPDCGEMGTGDCYLVHGTPFCNLEECCQTVCAIDPFCCDDTGQVFWPGRGFGSWDSWCVDHATELALAGHPDCGGPPVPPALPAIPVYNPNNPTPNFTDAQGYLTHCPYTDQNPFVVPPGTPCPGLPANPPANIAPALRYEPTGFPDIQDGWNGQGYDLQGIYSVGESLLDSGISFEDDNLTRGRSIKVGVIEHAAYLPSALGPSAPYEHEELTHVHSETGNNRFLIIPGTVLSEGSHGTAVLGIIGARNNFSDGTPRPLSEAPEDSLTNQMGMVGIAPDAELYFFSVSPISGAGTPDSIARALNPDGANFGPGDVLNFSIGPAECGTLGSDPADWLLLNTAVNSGVTCTVSAGNECCNLDAAGEFFGDSGVIIVGACTPGFGNYVKYCRLPFSSYCQECDAEAGSHVDVSAWGVSVATLGLGFPFDLFVGTSTNIYNRSYQINFGGTSSAAPSVAGLVACLQGLSKMKWGIPLTARQMRTVVQAHYAFGQCGFEGFGLEPPGSVGVDNIPCAFGFYSSGDWDPGAPADNFGVYSHGLGGAEEVVKGHWFSGNNSLDDIEILEGEHVFGNKFSIAASDNNYLIIDSVTSSPSGPGIAQRGNIALGKSTDVLVHFHTVGVLQNFSVQVESHVTGPPVIMLAYLYNWDALQWMIGGVAIVDGFDFTPDGFPDLFATIGTPGPFIDEANSNHVMVRIWTVSLGVAPQYKVFHDRISLDFSAFQFVPGF